MASESIFAQAIRKARNFLKCTTNSSPLREDNHSLRVDKVVSEVESAAMVEVLSKLGFAPGSHPNEMTTQLTDPYLSSILWDRIAQYAPSERPYRDFDVSAVALSDNWTITHIKGPGPATEPVVEAPRLVKEPLTVSLFTLVVYLGVSDDLDGANRTFEDSSSDVVAWPSTGLALLYPCDWASHDTELVAGSFFRLTTDIPL